MHEGLGVGSTAHNGAVRVVQRMLNGGVEQEYLTRNPKGMKKPRASRRDFYYTTEQWELVREQVR